jgi:ribosome-associated protein
MAEENKRGKRRTGKAMGRPVRAGIGKPKGISRSTRTGFQEKPDPARGFAVDAARLLHDDKCTEVVLLDVRGLSQVTNYIVIGSGTSDRQMRSVIQHVEELGRERGYPAWRSDTDSGGRWMLLDCVDVVVHVFEPSTRAHYDLEMLWGDAPRVAWERPDQENRDRAKIRSTQGL